MTEDKRSIIQMVADLIEQGKKNQDKIAYSKILDTFSGVEISSEQFDNILKVLEDNKIEVLRSKMTWSRRFLCLQRRKIRMRWMTKNWKKVRFFWILMMILRKIPRKISRKISRLWRGGYHGSGTSVFKDDRTGASAYHGRRAKDCQADQ